MVDVVRASDPRTPDGDLRGGPGGGLVNAWWATMLVSWLLTYRWCAEPPSVRENCESPVCIVERTSSAPVLIGGAGQLRVDAALPGRSSCRSASGAAAAKSAR